MENGNKADSGTDLHSSLQDRYTTQAGELLATQLDAISLNTAQPLSIESELATRLRDFRPDPTLLPDSECIVWKWSHQIVSSTLLGVNLSNVQVAKRPRGAPS
jgi:hypothetical protein